MMAFALLLIFAARQINMKQRKQLERRTFNQDRFEILIKRQKSGVATFSELTELDGIVNRDPDIRESVLEEMQALNDPPDEPQQEDTLSIPPIKTPSLLDKIAAFFKRLFMTINGSNPVSFS